MLEYADMWGGDLNFGIGFTFACAAQLVFHDYLWITLSSSACFAVLARWAIRRFGWVCCTASGFATSACISLGERSILDDPLSIVVIAAEACAPTFAVWGLLSLAFAVQIPTTPLEIMCRGCGYNLTGNISGRCPECGMKIAPSAT